MGIWSSWLWKDISVNPLKKKKNWSPTWHSPTLPENAEQPQRALYRKSRSVTGPLSTMVASPHSSLLATLKNTSGLNDSSTSVSLLRVNYSSECVWYFCVSLFDLFTGGWSFKLSYRHCNIILFLLNDYWNLALSSTFQE